MIQSVVFIGPDTTWAEISYDIVLPSSFVNSLDSSYLTYSPTQSGTSLGSSAQEGGAYSGLPLTTVVGGFLTYQTDVTYAGDGQWLVDTYWKRDGDLIYAVEHYGGNEQDGYQTVFQLNLAASSYDHMLPYEDWIDRPLAGFITDNTQIASTTTSYQEITLTDHSEWLILQGSARIEAGGGIDRINLNAGYSGGSTIVYSSLTDLTGAALTAGLYGDDNAQPFEQIIGFASSANTETPNKLDLSALSGFAYIGSDSFSATGQAEIRFETDAYLNDPEFAGQGQWGGWSLLQFDANGDGQVDYRLGLQQSSSGFHLYETAPGSLILQTTPPGWPVITSNGGGDTASASIEENAAVVTAVTATDPDPNQTLSFSIVGGDDAAKFQIDPETGVLSFISAPDYENPGDAGADNIYDVIVQVSNGQRGVDTQVLAVTVTDVNEMPNGAPSLTPDGRIEIAMTVLDGVRILNLLPDGSVKNMGIYLPSDAASYVASTGDVEGDGDRDILVSGDNGNGRLYLNNGDNTFSDSGARFPGRFQSDNALVDIDLDGDLDAVFHNGLGNIDIYSNSGGAGFTLTQSVDPGRGAGFAASRGFAAADFNGDGYSDLFIPLGNAQSDVPLLLVNDGTGHFVQQTQADLPSEAATRPAVGDVDGDGDLDIVNGGTAAFNDPVPGDGAVLLNDGNGNFTVHQDSFGAADTIAIELGDVDGDGDLDAMVRASSAGLALWKNDGAGGFQLHHTVAAGAIGAHAMSDFDGDGDLDLTYSAGNLVRSMVNDGQGNFTATGTPLPTSGFVFAFLGGDLLNDLNQSPEIAENTTAVTTVAATDPDGDTLAYTIIGGDDAAKFAINAQTGVLRFIAAPDFDNPADADADNEYVIEVQASDGKGGTVAETIRVAITNQNDNAPVFSSLATASIAENASGAAYDAEAADADNLRALTYTLSGADATLFDISASMGVVSFKSAPDFENPEDDDGDNVYDIVVTASDGTLATSHNVAISVTNVVGGNFNGTGSNNVITGTDEEDTIRGQGGADTLAGLGGDDLIDGGSGNDALYGGGGKDTLVGSIGADLLDGGAGDDVMEGGAGNDTYVVADVNDVVSELAGGGTDTVVTALSSYLLGADVENLVFSGTGSFHGKGNAQANVITGGVGNDVLDGSAGDDRLVGLAGDDRYHVDSSADRVVEAVDGGRDAVFTTSLSYTLPGNVEELYFIGQGGAFTGKGNDLGNVIEGGDGNDVLNGGGGNDSLIGGKGSDRISGGSGSDILRDSIGSGDDQYFGDGGIDWYVAAEAAVNTTINLLAGVASSALGGIDTLNGIENAQGGAGNDTITASTGRNELRGGTGSDTFVFASIAAAGKGASADFLSDFAPGDRIDISQIDANGTLTGTPSFTFAGEIATVSGGFGHLGKGQVGFRYQTDANGAEHTIIEGNTNATPEADFQIDILGRMQLTAGDFLL